jgi:hypothetical protein
MENNTSRMSNAARIAITAIWWIGCSAIDTVVKMVLQQVTAESAVNQLENSDVSYYQFQVLNHVNNAHALISMIWMIGTVLLWSSKLKSLHAKLPSGLYAIAVVIFALSFSTSAHAYYDKTDRAEWVNIEANQSAFLIPAVGANKTTQAQFGSVDYLTANKVAAKRVQIPHAKADNTSLIVDYYVPTATLYLVDRTPYTREWVDAADRGTSTKAQGFHFESADSVNIKTGVTISASVAEEDAAKFFYWFGTSAIKISQDPQDVFASVKYGKSLSEVMDTVVRAKVQQVLAREFSKRPFMKAINDKAAIMDAVEQSVKDEFAKKGITIAFVGYAEELNFDPRIQKAIDDAAIAGVQYANKDALLAVVEINRKNAEVDVVRAQAKAIGNWNGQVNFPFIMPDSFAKAIADFLSNTSKK